MMDKIIFYASKEHIYTLTFRWTSHIIKTLVDSIQLHTRIFRIFLERGGGVVEEEGVALLSVSWQGQFVCLPVNEALSQYPE